MKKGLLILGIAVMGFTAGCYVEAYPPVGAEVVVEPGHVHTEWCGHYYYGGRWYYSQGHRHGPGCGHVLRGGVWVWAR